MPGWGIGKRSCGEESRASRNTIPLHLARTPRLPDKGQIRCAIWPNPNRQLLRKYTQALVPRELDVSR
jgi:hypothetical protein